jgi:hypothetical protein
LASFTLCDLAYF